MFGKKEKMKNEVLLDALITPQQENQTDMSKVVDQLVNTKNDEKLLERLSELSPHQIMGITVLLTTAKKYKISFLKTLIYQYLSLMFSKNRKSRQEIIELFKSYTPEVDLEKLELMKSLKR